METLVGKGWCTRSSLSITGVLFHTVYDTVYDTVCLCCFNFSKYLSESNLFWLSDFFFSSWNFLSILCWCIELLCILLWHELQ